MGWEFTIPGYLFVFGVLAIYIAVTLRRGKRLAAQLPEERRRFLD